MSSYRSGYIIQPKYKPNTGFKKYSQTKPFRQLILLDLPEHLRSIDVLAEKFQPYGRIFGIKFLQPRNFENLQNDAKQYIGDSNLPCEYGAIVEFETARTAKFCCGVLRKRVKQQGFRIAVLKPGAESELLAQKQILLSEDCADSLYSSSNSSSSNWRAKTKTSQSSIDVDLCRSSSSSCSDESYLKINTSPEKLYECFTDLRISSPQEKTKIQTSKAHLAVGFGRPKTQNQTMTNYKYRISNQLVPPPGFNRQVNDDIFFSGNSYYPSPQFRQMRMTPFDKF